jgi:hypothetical protein
MDIGGLREIQLIRRGKRKGELSAKVPEKLRLEKELIGWERQLIYKTYFLTGLRKNELAQLTIEQLELDGPQPFIVLDSSEEKNGEGNQVPIRHDLAKEIKEWLAEKAKREGELPPSAKVFYVPSGLIRIMNRDLALAGIPKKDDRGRTLDIHAIRHSFNTHLAKKGIGVRTRQAAMRHSKSELTDIDYVDSKVLEVGSALDVLPSLPIQKFAPEFAPTSDNLVQTSAQTDKMAKIVKEATKTDNAESQDEKVVLQSTYDGEVEKRGRSSVGRALASQAGCRGFEFLPAPFDPLSAPGVSVSSAIYLCAQKKIPATRDCEDLSRSGAIERIIGVTNIGTRAKSQCPGWP